MKHVYINSHLHPLTLAVTGRRPREWLFSRGEPWLLLTPPRLGRLGVRLGVDDERVSSLLALILRWHPQPEHYCRSLGLEECAQPSQEEYPLAICPYCDRLHYPHPADALLPCPKCRDEQERKDEPGPGIMEDRRLDREMRQWMFENDPGAFDDGVLSPNWRINKMRRLKRDWHNAVNRILMGLPYRTVAEEYDCSVGLLHRKVHDHIRWQNN